MNMATMTLIVQGASLSTILDSIVAGVQTNWLLRLSEQSTERDILMRHQELGAVLSDKDFARAIARMRELGGRCEAKLYPGLSHEDLIATFSPLFRKKAPVLSDVSAFLHRNLG